MHLSANMLCSKAIQSSFMPNSPFLFHRHSSSTRKIVLVPCKCSNASGSGDPQPGGDKEQQELLAQIAMLQAQKLREINYLDERSEYLTQFVEEANAEIEQVGENALRQLDEVGSRILENMESKMQAFEESVGLNQLEIEENEKKLADFEEEIEKERNEGLFFKNLTTQKSSPSKETIAAAKEEAGKLREIAKENAGSKIRRNVYLALVGLVVIGFFDALVTSADWRKVAVLGAILAGLATQILYEQGMMSEVGKSEQEKTGADKE